MSLIGRLTNDYSPLKSHSTDKKERNQYEAAVNARREMLEVIATQPQPKLTKKQREFFCNMGTSCIRGKGESMEVFLKRQADTNARAKRVIRQS